VGEFPFRLVTVDIDGTLTLVHGWHEIAAAFHRLPDYDRTQRRFLSHEIGEEPHLMELLDLATGHTVAEVLAVVARTPTLDHIALGVKELHRRGSRAALLTHNPPYVSEYYRRTFGFDDDEGSPDPPIVNGVIGPPSSARADKLAGLQALIDRAQVPRASVVHVGDGWSDAEVFPHVGGGVALNSPFPEVNRAADLRLKTRDFLEVVSALSRMVPRAERPAER
jgi:phosphoserine phosphatase